MFLFLRFGDLKNELHFLKKSYLYPELPTWPKIENPYLAEAPSVISTLWNRSLYALYYPDDTVEGLADILQWQWIELDLHTNINRLHGIAMYYKPDMEYGCCMSTEKEINKHNITAF